MIAAPTFLPATPADTIAATPDISVPVPPLQVLPASNFGELLAEEGGGEMSESSVLPDRRDLPGLVRPAWMESGRAGHPVAPDRSRLAMRAPAPALPTSILAPFPDGTGEEVATGLGGPSAGASPSASSRAGEDPAAWLGTPMLEAPALAILPLAVPVPARPFSFLGKNGPLEPAATPGEMAWPGDGRGDVPVPESRVVQASRELERSRIPFLSPASGEPTVLAPARVADASIPGTTKGPDAPRGDSSTGTPLREFDPVTSVVAEATRGFSANARSDRSLDPMPVSLAKAPATLGNDLMPDPGILPAAAGSFPPSAPTGIPAAKSVMAMKKMEQVSLRSEKPASQTIRTARVSPVSADPAGPPLGSAAAAPPLREKTVTPPAEHPLWLGAALRQFERTGSGSEPDTVPVLTPVQQIESQMHGAIAELKRLRPDSMSVVLRPDGQTELHLHLSVVDGAVQVEARLQRGDAAVLGAEWAQLQQNLFNQGVRLSQLQEIPASPAPPPGGGFAPPEQRHAAPDPGGTPPSRAGAPPSPRPTGSTAVLSASPDATPGRAWETWA